MLGVRRLDQGLLRRRSNVLQFASLLAHALPLEFWQARGIVVGYLEPSGQVDERGLPDGCRSGLPCHAGPEPWRPPPGRPSRAAALHEDADPRALRARGTGPAAP